MALIGRLERLSHESTLLRGNPLGDPHVRSCYVYLPPGYDEGEEQYPVVMVLAGYGATNHSLVGYDPWEPNVVERFDRLLALGKSEPAILVMPDAMNRWGGSQFIDSPATGPYQSYLVEEILPFVDERFRTVAEREGRAVVGRSSGGFGALRLGLDRPEAFAVIGSHAGDSAFDISILPELRSAAIEYDRAGGLPAFIERFEENPRTGDFNAMMIAAYASAYAPIDGGPLPRCELPFAADTAEMERRIWERWLAHDPVQRLRSDGDAMRGAQLVYLDAGNRDEHGLHFGARVLASLLRERGVAVEHEEFDGGHRGTAYRYDVSLPRLVAACSR